MTSLYLLVVFVLVVIQISLSINLYISIADRMFACSSIVNDLATFFTPHTHTTRHTCTINSRYRSLFLHVQSFRATFRILGSFEQATLQGLERCLLALRKIVVQIIGGGGDGAS